MDDKVRERQEKEKEKIRKHKPPLNKNKGGGGRTPKSSKGRVCGCRRRRCGAQSALRLPLASKRKADGTLPMRSLDAMHVVVLE